MAETSGYFVVETLISIVEAEKIFIANAGVFRSGASRFDFPKILPGSERIMVETNRFRRYFVTHRPNRFLVFVDRISAKGREIMDVNDSRLINPSRFDNAFDKLVSLPVCVCPS